MQSLYGRIRHEYISALWSGASGVLLSFMIGVLSARILSVEDRGIMQYLIVLSAILSSVLSFGIPFSNSYFEAKAVRGIQDRWIIFPYVFIVVAVFLWWSWNDGMEVSTMDLLFFSFSFSCYYYLSERYKSPNRLYLYSRLVIMQPLFCLVYIVVGLLYFNEVRAFIIGYGASYVSSVVLLLVWDKFSIFKSNKVNVSTAFNLRYVLGYWFTLISSVTVINMDKIFIAATLTKFELGVYAVVQTASSVISRMSERIAVTYFVIGAGEGVGKLRLTALKIVFIFSFPMAATGWLVGEYFLPFVFSDKYAGYSLQSGLLFLSVFFGSVSWVLAQQVNSSGRPYLNMIRNFLSCAVFIVITESEVFGVGLTAVSLAVVYSGLFRFVYSYVFSV